MSTLWIPLFPFALFFAWLFFPARGQDLPRLPEAAPAAPIAVHEDPTAMDGGRVRLPELRM